MILGLALALGITLDDGRVLPVDLRKPDGAQGRLPALMLFGGFQSAARVLDKVQQPTPTPVIWASFNYPFDPPRKFRFPESLQYAPQMRSAIHGSFEGIGKLHDLLRARPDVDPARIVVVGASAGAPFATVGAARYGIPGLVLVHGFARPVPVIQNVIMRRRADRWYAPLLRGPAWLLAQWIVWYCEVPGIADHAAQLTAAQRVFMVSAEVDDFIPRQSSEALWTALERSQARRERLILPGGHLGVGDDSAQIADILQRSFAWMQKEGLL